MYTLDETTRRIIFTIFTRLDQEIWNLQLEIYFRRWLKSYYHCADV
jgi:hypothetical protein